MSSKRVQSFICVGNVFLNELPSNTVYEQTNVQYIIIITWCKEDSKHSVLVKQKPHISLSIYIFVFCSLIYSEF